MNVLLIGGYRFLGRAIVDAACRDGHRICAFNRGLTWPADLRDVELITGDRVADLDKLRGRTWDAVIDTSGYHPRTVAASAKALAQSAGNYTFISTVSVYPWPIPAGTTEDDAVDVMGENDDANGDEPESYGRRKALCEAEVAYAFPERSLSIRPGMIVGPYDETERFTYWVARAARGGTMLAPGDPARSLQMIDVADLATFALALAKNRTTGIVNATGPLEGSTWQKFTDACFAGTRATGRAVWLDDETLLANGFMPGTDFPWWIGSAENGIFELDLTRARRYGLRCRPLEETVARTWEWLQRLPAERRPLNLAPLRETELLALLSAD